MTQLLCHLFGDYVLQSPWMADNKTKHWLPAIVHACVYFIPFLLVLHPSITATVVVVGTHAVIDRFRLAKYLIFTSQHISPPKEWKKWSNCSGTGYYAETPIWLAGWLMIIVDNTVHLTINALCLSYL